VLDRPLPEARFAAPGSRDAVLVRNAEALPYVGEQLGHGQRLLGAYVVWDPERVDRLTDRLARPLDPLRILLADFLTDQTDRHERNWLVTTDARRNDRWHLVPIDHAFSFNNLPVDSQVHDPLPGRAASPTCTSAPSSKVNRHGFDAASL
jgi:hypothetical protein